MRTEVTSIKNDKESFLTPVGALNFILKKIEFILLVILYLSLMKYVVGKCLLTINTQIHEIQFH